MKIHTLNTKQINYKTTFNGGLTRKMNAEISSCDVRKISDEFTRNNVIVDFNGNKTLAWCFLQVLNIIKKLNLSLPKAILVEDFDKLSAEEGNYSFCTTIPRKIIKGSPNRIPERVISYNSNINWNKIDKISDKFKELGLTSSDFFLKIFCMKQAIPCTLKTYLKI